MSRACAHSDDEILARAVEIKAGRRKEYMRQFNRAYYQRRWRDDPEYRKRRREYAHEYWARADVKRRWRERYRDDPEFRERRREYAREYSARPKVKERYRQRYRLKKQQQLEAAR